MHQKLRRDLSLSQIHKSKKKEKLWTLSLGSSLSLVPIFTSLGPLEVEQGRITMATIIDEDFDDPNADLVLIAVDDDAPQGEPKKHRIFRVQQKLLAIPFTCFETMVDISAGAEGPPDRSEVRMEESVPVIKMILGAAYNNAQFIDALVKSQDWQFILEVWEASNKYSFFLLRALTSSLLQ